MSTDYRTCECGETFADCADGQKINFSVQIKDGDEYGCKENS